MYECEFTIRITRKKTRHSKQQQTRATPWQMLWGEKQLQTAKIVGKGWFRNRKDSGFKAL